MACFRDFFAYQNPLIDQYEIQFGERSEKINNVDRLMLTEELSRKIYCMQEKRIKNISAYDAYIDGLWNYSGNIFSTSILKRMYKLKNAENLSIPKNAEDILCNIFGDKLRYVRNYQRLYVTTHLSYLTWMFRTEGGQKPSLNCEDLDFLTGDLKQLPNVLDAIGFIKCFLGSMERRNTKSKE